MARAPFKLRSGNSTPFKQMGSSPVKQESKTYKKSKKEGVYTKQGRSHTPGPVVGSIWDPTTEEVKGTAPKTSKKVGPEQSPKTLEKEWTDVDVSKEKLRESGKSIFSKGPEAKAHEKELAEAVEAEAYVKK